MKWPLVAVSKVAEINPRRKATDALESDEVVGFVPMASISEESARIVALETKPFSEVRKGFTFFRENDVLFAKITPCMENGKVAIAHGLPQGVGFGSTEFHVLRAKQGILPDFLYFLVRQPSLRRAAQRQFRGAAGQQRVPESFFADYLMPVPPPSEQRRIVDLLKQADNLRHQRSEADAIARRILPALFRKMFGDPSRNDRSWPTESLLKICSPKQWPTISSRELMPSGYPVYGANGKIGFYSSFNHEHPTVLITCRGATCGTLNVCEPKSYVTGNAMALDDPDASKTTGEFLEWFLRVRGLGDTITGAAQPQITRANLAVVNVPTPPMPLILAFTKQAKAVKQICESQQAARDTIETLFQTMLHRAFTGELTTRWREGHSKELLEEMEIQSRHLASHTVAAA